MISRRYPLLTDVAYMYGSELRADAVNEETYAYDRRRGAWALYWRTVG